MRRREIKLKIHTSSPMYKNMSLQKQNPIRNNPSFFYHYPINHGHFLEQGPKLQNQKSIR